MLTLLIPVLIHLFNRSRGRLVRIGHIDLVRQAKKLRVTEMKLAQWLLLFLRLGIFALAALILVGLARQGLESSTEATVYVTPAWLATSQTEDIKKVLHDTEREPGTRVLVLQPGFPPLDPGWLEGHKPKPLINVEDINNVWPLLAERLSIERHGGPVKVFATDYSLQYGKRRPALPRDISWRLTHPQPVAAANSTAIRAVIAHDHNRVSEVVLLSAVLATLKEHRLPGLGWELTDLTRMNDRHLSADWLILLSDIDISPAQLALMPSSAVVLTDANEGSAEITRQYVNLPFYPFSTFRLNRYTKNLDGNETREQGVDRRVLLSTVEGDPLLEEFSSGPVRRLHFNSRFVNDWNSITQQAEFPELLMSVMLNDQSQLQRFANARINPARLQSATGKAGTDLPLPRRSMQGLLALILVLLWVTERWLSERKPREIH